MGVMVSGYTCGSFVCSFPDFLSCEPEIAWVLGLLVRVLSVSSLPPTVVVDSTSGGR